MAQSVEQLQAARELAAQYGLNGADFYQHKQSKSWLISRTGIEKIQYKAGIEVGFEAVRVEPEFAAVKALASRKAKAEGAKLATKLTIQTFGSACKLNCQVSYYLEMAEKRALSRAVLKLSDFYQLGVYGEDEMPPVSFQKEEMSDIGTGTSVVAEAPKKPVAEASAPASAPLAPSVGADQSIAGPAEIPAEVLAKFTRQIEATTSALDLQTLWAKLTKHEKAALFAVKEAAKQRLADATAQAVAQASQQNPGVLKVAGSDTALVDEFIEKPVFGPGPAVEYATAEQLEFIHKLLNHPAITRKEKTALLLGINKLDRERARQAIGKLRTAIGEREGIDPRDGVRQQLKNLVAREGAKLPTEYADRLLAFAAHAEATLEELVDAHEQVTAWLVDEETYGTDAELAAADDQPAIAA